MSILNTTAGAGTNRRCVGQPLPMAMAGGGQAYASGCVCASPVCVWAREDNE
jgi:hypothetical protein